MVLTVHVELCTIPLDGQTQAKRRCLPILFSSCLILFGVHSASRCGLPGEIRKAAQYR